MAISAPAKRAQFCLLTSTCRLLREIRRKKRPKQISRTPNTDAYSIHPEGRAGEHFYAISISKVHAEVRQISAELGVFVVVCLLLPTYLHAEKRIYTHLCSVEFIKETSAFHRNSAISSQGDYMEQEHVRNRKKIVVQVDFYFYARGFKMQDTKTLRPR